MKEGEEHLVVIVTLFSSSDNVSYHMRKVNENFITMLNFNSAVSYAVNCEL